MPRTKEKRAVPPTATERIERKQLSEMVRNTPIGNPVILLDMTPELVNKFSVLLRAKHRRKLFRS